MKLGRIIIISERERELDKNIARKEGHIKGYAEGKNAGYILGIAEQNQYWEEVTRSMNDQLHARQLIQDIGLEW